MDKINSLKLENWRSFDKKGIELTDLKKFNLFVGPNNVGKSNIIKYLHNLMLYIDSTCVKSYEEWTEELKRPISSSERWDEDKSIFSEINICSNNENITINCEHTNDLNCITAFTSSSKYKKNVKKVYKFCKFFSSMEYIYTSRDIDSSRQSNSTKTFDGHYTMNDIGTIRSKEALKKKGDCFGEQMSIWLSDILGEETIFEYENRDVKLVHKRNNKLKSMSLMDNLGTGVAEVVMILAKLYLHKLTKDHLTVLFEEPESHLHPDALIKFFDIIKRLSKDAPFQYFITSHSIGLIDKISKADGSVYRVTKRENGSSDVMKCDNLFNDLNLLDDLGVRPSQLLISNFIIWIEGPSDRKYIKKWIECFTQGKLVENEHYTFAMYGGRNISNYSIEEYDSLDELINIIKFSRYAVIVCDRDNKFSEEDIERSHIGRLQNKIIELSLNDRIKIWVTEGREIENYVPISLMQDVLVNKSRRQSVSGVPVKIDIKKIKSKEVHIRKEESFDNFFGKMFVIDKSRYKKNKINNSKTLKDLQAIISRDDFAGPKNEIAGLVSAKWQEDHFKGSDLQKRIKEVVALIYSANGFK
ncbi:ATP-dependent nuclease [Bacillus cereus]